MLACFCRDGSGRRKCRRGAGGRKQGILVCRADMDENDPGDFTTPAMLEQGPLVVTVSAGGSPALAARVRDELAAVSTRAGPGLPRRWQRFVRDLPWTGGSIRRRGRSIATWPPMRRWMPRSAEWIRSGHGSSLATRSWVHMPEVPTSDKLGCSWRRRLSLSPPRASPSAGSGRKPNRGDCLQGMPLRRPRPDGCGADLALDHARPVVPAGRQFRCLALAGRPARPVSGLHAARAAAARAGLVRHPHHRAVSGVGGCLRAGQAARIRRQHLVAGSSSHGLRRSAGAFGRRGGGSDVPDRQPAPAPQAAPLLWGAWSGWSISLGFQSPSVFRC